MRINTLKKVNRCYFNIHNLYFKAIKCISIRIKYKNIKILSLDRV